MWTQYHAFAQDTLAISVFAIIICGTFGMIAIRWLSPLLLEKASFLLSNFVTDNRMAWLWSGGGMLLLSAAGPCCQGPTNHFVNASLRPET